MADFTYEDLDCEAVTRSLGSLPTTSWQAKDEDDMTKPHVEWFLVREGDDTYVDGRLCMCLTREDHYDENLGSLMTQVEGFLS